MDQRLLYDRESAAKQLSTSARRIDELRRSGRLLAVWDGNKHKFTHEDLQRYVDSLQPLHELRPIAASPYDL